MKNNIKYNKEINLKEIIHFTTQSKHFIKLEHSV